MHLPAQAASLCTKQVDDTDQLPQEQPSSPVMHSQMSSLTGVFCISLTSGDITATPRILSDCAQQQKAHNMLQYSCCCMYAG
jgi:hypothetical protein